MAYLIISSPSNFKQTELPANVKKESKDLIFTQMQDILTKLKKIGTISSLPALNKEKDNIGTLRNKAIGLHKFFSENMALEDNKSIEELQAIFNEIVSGTFDLEKKLTQPANPVKAQPVQGINSSIIAQLKQTQQRRSTQPSDTSQLPASHVTKPLPTPPIKTVAKATSNVQLTQVQENLRILIDLLQQPGNISSEGLFRLSGYVNVLKATDVNKLDAVAVKQIKDVNTVAGLLKKVLREMPEPLLETVKEKLLEVNPKTEVEKIKIILEDLSAENKQTLKMLIGFLAEVAVNVSQNKMTPVNLAVCFVPNLFMPAQSMEAMMAQMQNTPQLNAVFTALIENNAQIFG